MSSPDAQADSTSAPHRPVETEQLAVTPLALRLPDEVWLLILRGAGYVTLKRAQRVCKKLQRIVRHSKVDRILFRQNIDPAANVYNYVLHPLLNAVDCMWVTETEAHLRSDQVDPPDVGNVYKSPACDEFATSPACPYITLTMAEFAESAEGCDVVANPAGLTVRDVLVAVARYWQDTGAESPAMLTCEYAFQGWERLEVLPDRSVLLEAKRFAR